MPQPPAKACQGQVVGGAVGLPEERVGIPVNELDQFGLP
jgi:hypothetical protein